MHKHQDLFSEKKRSLDEIKKEHKKLEALFRELHFQLRHHELSKDTSILTTRIIENHKEQVKKLLKKIGEKEQIFRSIITHILKQFEHIYKQDKTQDSYRRYSYMKQQMDTEVSNVARMTQRIKEKFEEIMNKL